MSSLYHPAPCDHPIARLVCFPHAGGAASFFRDWPALLPGVDVLAVRYPGRAERITEPPATDLIALADEVAADIAARQWTGPIALFGHSLGAVVALETARALEHRGVAPAHLFASGSHDGPLPDLGESAQDDDETILRLLELGGTPPELAADPDFQELVLPYVRADGAMFHDYGHLPAPALGCPVTTIKGDVDTDADRRPWRALTPRLTEHVVPGNHFYLIDRPPAGIVADALTSAMIGVR